MPKNVFSQSDCRILETAYLENETVNELDFLHVDTNLGKKIGDSFFFENHDQKCF